MALEVIVVGAGKMGREHLKVLTKPPFALSNESIGIYDPNNSKLEEVAAQYRNIRMLSRLQGVRAPKAIVASPAEFHHANARDLNNVGAILFEKPLAESITDGRAIAALKGPRMMCGLLGFFHQEFSTMFENLHVIGDLVSVNEQLHESNPALTPYISGTRGVILNNAIHSLERVSRLVDTKLPGDSIEVISVSKGRRSFTAAPGDGEDFADIELKSSSGVPFSVNVSYRNAEKCSENNRPIFYTLTVEGTLGTIVVTGWEKTELTLGNNSTQTIFEYPDIMADNPGSQYAIRIPYSLIKQCEAFFAHAENTHTPALHPTMLQGLKAQELVEACYSME